MCVPGSAGAQAPIVHAGDELAGGPDAAPYADRAAPQRRERPDWLERERVGPPYEADGRWYVPTPEPGYEQTGMASWYGPEFRGQLTASGEAFDEEALTAAHPTLPIPSLAQVTNLENGREVIVRINDRGPFSDSRLIDVSRAAAEALGFVRNGDARVHVRYLGPAPRRIASAGDDSASSSTWGGRQPGPSRCDGADYEGPSRFHDRRAAPGGGYAVQVGAYADPENARRAFDIASLAGPVTVHTIRTARDGRLFRVRVGPWRTQWEADAARCRLVSLGFVDAYVAAR